MTLRHEPDVSHGDWVVGDDWVALSSFGPPVFDSYARLPHPVDGPDPDDPQELMNVEGDLDDESLAALVRVLRRHTTTPDDCFFALWEGFGEIYGSPAVQAITLGGTGAEPPSVPPAFPATVVDGPRLHIPHRSYLLFRGPLDEAGAWGAADAVPGWPRRINSPNLMWPADHAWFVASEIDQPWTGVGGSAELVTDLVHEPPLDARYVTRPL